MFTSEDYYKDADSGLKNQLKRFDLMNVQQTVHIDNTKISYYEVTNEKPVLLMLPGATGKGISLFRIAQQLQDEFHIFMLDYPDIDELDSAALAIIKMMKDRGIERFNVLAHSYGSFLLQGILKHEPKMVNKLVTINGYSKYYMGFFALRTERKNLQRFLKFINYVPFNRYQDRYASKTRVAIDIYKENKPYQKFWKGFYEELLMISDKEETITNYRMMLDYWKEFVGPITFDDFEGEALCITTKGGNVKGKEGLISSFNKVEEKRIDKSSSLALVEFAGDIVQSTKNFLRE